MLVKYGLGRSLIDVAFGVTIERRYGQQASILAERWLSAVERTIATLGKYAGTLGHEQPDIGDLSIAVGLGYVDFRLQEVRWRGQATQLGEWCERIAARPSLVATSPH
jgi:glutathione S-transferase